MDASIFFEREKWKAPLAWSAALHMAMFAGIFGYAAIVGGQHNEDWGGASIGDAMSATLVSRAPVPLPPSLVQTENVLANQSPGLSQSLIPEVEQPPEALPIPERTVKPKPEQHTAQPKPKPHTPPPPPQENVVPFGEGGPVSGPYAVFTTHNAKGGLSFTGGGDFGSQFGWYVDVVRRKVSENWLKYEVDPSITSARRVYIVFDIQRSGEPGNVQVEQSSGVPSLDQSAVRALQRIDTFGALPPAYRGSKVSVEFWFDYKR